MINRKILALFILSLFIISLPTPRPAAGQNAESNNQLPTLPVFTTDSYGGWAGSGLGLTLETTEFSFLPLDEAVRYQNEPALKVSATGEFESGGWWTALLAGKDWESYSLEPYLQSGSLNFAIKGAVGGEDFDIEFRDASPGRDPLNLSTVKVNIKEFGTVSTDWQTISIPLSRFPAAGDQRFDFSQISTISLSSANTNPINFWIADIHISSPDPEQSYAAIKVNQVGYRPDGIKQALVSGFDGSFPLVNGDTFMIKSASDGSVVFEGQLRLVAELDRYASGERVLEADFSALDQTGEFVLSVDSDAIPDSVPFEIDPNVYGPLVTDTMRYFYLQRSGIELTPEFAGDFARPVGHPQDAQAEFRSGLYGPRDVSGGWYDAGDYGKYVNAGATAVSDLLWTYEMFPWQFPDNHLTIPESGNGIPDILDEIKWELDWMMKMQDPETGGFYHMVQPTENATPHQSDGTRYIEDDFWGTGDVKPSAGTGSAVAALAHAAYVFGPIDAGYAAELQAAAELGYQYLVDNTELVNPVEGAYADWDDVENRFWAATSLYRLTGDESYHDAAKAQYRNVRTTFDSTNDNGYGVQDMGMIAWLPYIYAENQDPAVRQFFEQEFTAWSDHMTQRWEASVWNHTLLDEDYYWGSNYVALTTPLILYTGHLALGNDVSTAQAISQQALDYLLGSNPLALSYVSGFGENATSNVHSALWSYDSVQAIPPGIMAGGPNEYNNPLLPTKFPGKSYLDTPTNWTMNEHTIYWNSALVFHAAMQAEESTQRIVEVSATIQAELAEQADTMADQEVAVEQVSAGSNESASESVEVAQEESLDQTAADEMSQEVLVDNSSSTENSAANEQASGPAFDSDSMWLIVGGAAAGVVVTLLLVGIGFALGRRRSG